MTGFTSSQTITVFGDGEPIEHGPQEVICDDCKVIAEAERVVSE